MRHAHNAPFPTRDFARTKTLSQIQELSVVSNYNWGFQRFQPLLSQRSTLQSPQSRTQKDQPSTTYSAYRMAAGTRPPTPHAQALKTGCRSKCSITDILHRHKQHSSTQTKNIIWVLEHTHSHTHSLTYTLSLSCSAQAVTTTTSLKPLCR